MALCLAACDESCSPPAAPPACPCERPTRQGVLERKAIDEASGIAASRKHPGVFYVHNDSGDAPRIFAIDDRGRDRGEIAITGAEAVDWEDIAVGPCGDDSCIYVGDIGDNDEERTSYTVYRIREPEQLRGHAAAEPIVFTYPDGAHDAETLLVHPTTGRAYVVTKVKSKPAGLYALPSSSGGVAEHLAEVRLPHKVTGGDVHPSGSGLALRSDGEAFFYALPNDDVGAAFTSPKCKLPLSTDPDGEALGFTREGYVTVSEGKKAGVWVTACTDM